MSLAARERVSGRQMAGQEGDQEEWMQLHRGARGEDPRDVPKANSTAGSGAGPRTAPHEGLCGVRVPKGVPQGVLWAPMSSKVSPRIFLEQNLLPLLPTRVTFVSGQQNTGRRPCVLGAGGAELVMATARSPVGGPRALPGS